MKVFFDTSVIVPFSDESHIHHGRSLDRILQYQNDAVIDVRVLAETYATLSGKMRKPVEEALLFISEISTRFEVVELTVTEYLKAVTSCASRGISGAAVYDALHARCAVKAGVEVLYTWNVKDFVRLGPEVAGLVRTP